MWEDELSEGQIRGWRAVSAAGLHGKGLPKRSVFVHRHRLLLREPAAFPPNSPNLEPSRKQGRQGLTREEFPMALPRSSLGSAWSGDPRLDMKRLSGEETHKTWMLHSILRGTGTSRSYFLDVMVVRQAGTSIAKHNTWTSRRLRSR